MGRVGLAFKVFFKVLFDKLLAQRVESALSNEPLPKITAPDPSAKAEKAPPKPARSEALTLLEALQREARLVDLCQDALDQYTDEQIGSAARNVLRDSRQVLERFFALTPVAREGTDLELPIAFDPACYRLTGKVDQPPYRGHITHGGWQATRCELPQWTGSKESALVVAPAEVEVA